MTELSRPVPLDKVGTARSEHVVEASPAELDALAARLRIPAVLGLRCRFELRRLPGAVIAADGVLDAAVVQTCVASSEPFEAAVHDEFAVHFVPAGTEAADDDLDAPDQIAYAGGGIDLGEAAAEQLALALDPYPRRPEEGEAPTTPEEAHPNPFAALSALRRKQ